jgi:hypothetical protein
MYVDPIWLYAENKTLFRCPNPLEGPVAKGGNSMEIR